MRELLIDREVQGRESRRRTGRPIRGSHTRLAENIRVNPDAGIGVLPVDISDTSDDQNADGTFPFMVDFSAVDGGDAVA